MDTHQCNIVKNSLNKNEQFILRNWILTGSISRKYNQYKNKPDQINCRLITKNINYTKFLLLESLKLGINKHSQIQALSYLSIGNFKSKKIFKALFPLIIINLDHLYEFLEFTKSFRGFGSVIISAVHDWIRSKSFDELQKQIITYPKNYNWSFADVINMFSPMPRSSIEKDIFNYCLNKTKFKQLKIFNGYEEIKRNIDVEKNIEITKITNKNFPGNITKTESYMDCLANNMDIKELIKNINSIKPDVLLRNIKNKINENSVNFFYLVSMLNTIQNSELKDEIKELIIKHKKPTFNKKITMFIDTDLQFTTINKVNGIVYPSLFNNNYNTKYFFKNKILDFNPNEYTNFMYLNMENRVGSYSTAFLKHILFLTQDEEIIIVWFADKKIVLRENDLQGFRDKKLIIISSNQNVDMPRMYNNVYLLKGISYKTIDLLKLMIEDDI